MQVFGWLLFGVGSLFLIVAGLVGLNGVGNIPGLLIGTACMISGSVFVGACLIVDAISDKEAQADSVQPSTPESANNLSSSSENQGIIPDQQTPEDKQLLLVYGILLAVIIVALLAMWLLGGY